MSEESELAKVIDFSSKSALKQLLDEDTSEEIIEYGGNETRKLAELNKKHAFIHSYYGKPMVMCYVYDAVIGRNIYEFITPESFVMRYINDTMVVPTKNGRGATAIEVGKWWLRHPSRREYETVIFDPTHLERDKYGVSVKHNSLNLWEGFAVEPKKGGWKRIRRHLWKVACNQDKTKFRYLIKWMAWCFQNPGTRSEVCVIWKGKKGAGKGFIATQMLQIFGKHGLAISNRKHLTGQFNEHLQAVSFLFADEAYYPGDKEVEGTLKALITEPYFLVEGKGKQARQARNCLHIMMATNNEWVIPADASERRFFINEVDSRYTKGGIDENKRIQYFKDLWTEANSGGREAMLHDMLKMELYDWHPREDVPETEELHKQKLQGMDRREKAILSLLEQGVIPGFREKGRLMVRASIINEYIDKLEPGRTRIHPKDISITLKQLGADTQRTSKGTTYVIPSLRKMREAWCRHHVYGEFTGTDDWIILNEQEY